MTADPPGQAPRRDAAPLSGIRVVDLVDVEGAYATRLLAGLGAEVIKVEPPGGHRTRKLAPFAREVSLWFAYFGAGKRSVVIDLDTPAGREQLRQLVGTADVVIESWAPGKLAERDIDHHELRKQNPRLIWAALTPFGQTGPRRNWKSSDMLAWASSGVLLATGFPGQAPLNPGGPADIALHLASLQAACGVLLALRTRRATGGGQFIDISLQDVALTATELRSPLYLDGLVGGYFGLRRQGNRRGSPFGLYECKDGWVCIVALHARQLRILGEWMGEVTGNDLLADPAFADPRMALEAVDAIDTLVEEFCGHFTKGELQQEGQRRGIPVTQVNTIADLVTDPHLAASGYWDEVDDPLLGRLRVAGPPLQSSSSMFSARPAPELGTATEDVLGGLPPTGPGTHPAHPGGQHS
jgi:crotonobetainyl-CoA:carnitine CoA-transferase CaiB-like acyl-CoA transferase